MLEDKRRNFSDYTWCGATIIASNVPTYRRTMINGVHGILVENNSSAWVQGISSLIENKEKRRFLTTGAGLLLRNGHLQEQTIASWYQLIWRIMKLTSESTKKGWRHTAFAERSPLPPEVVEYPAFPPVLGPPHRGL